MLALKTTTADAFVQPLFRLQRVEQIQFAWKRLLYQLTIVPRHQSDDQPIPQPVSI